MDAEMRALVALLRSDDAATQFDGIAALANRVRHDSDAALAAGRAGALAAVVALLHARPDEYHFLPACEALTDMMYEGAAQDWDVATVDDALQAVLCGMAAQLSDADVQNAGCAVVDTLFGDCVDVIDDVYGGDAAVAVLAALRAHPDHGGLHELGWRALRDVCGHGRPREAQRAFESGMVFEVAVASLRANSDDAMFQCYACSVMLAPFRTQTLDMSVVRAAAVAAGVVGATITAIRVMLADTQPECYTDSVFEEALALLYDLAVDAAAAAQAVQDGALELLLLELLPRAASGDHAAHASGTLALLVAAEAHARRALACGAMEACVGALRAHGTSAVVVAVNALHALDSLAKVSPGAAHRAGAAPVVRAVLNAHRNDAELVRTGPRILAWLKLEAAAAADAAMASLMAEEEAERGAKAAPPAGKRKSKGKGKKTITDAADASRGASGSGSAADASAAAPSSAPLVAPLSPPPMPVLAAQNAADGSDVNGPATARDDGASVDADIQPAAVIEPSAASSGAASGPESLSVRVFVCRGGGVAVEQPTSTLARWFAEGPGVICGDTVFVTAQLDASCDAAPMPGSSSGGAVPPGVLFRDVLLRKVALPGYGVLPDGWVPARIRCQAALLSQLAAAPDARALRRVMTSTLAVTLRELHCVNLAFVSLGRLIDLGLAAPLRGPWCAPWDADAIDDVLATAHDALVADCVTDSDVRMATRVLANLASAPWPLPPYLTRTGAALMLVLLRLLQTPQLLSDVNRNDAMAWLAWAFRVEVADVLRWPGRRTAVDAFSRAGGAVLLASDAMKELTDGSGADKQAQDARIERALRLLHTCAGEDTRVVQDGNTAALALAALRLPSASYNTRNAAAALLALRLRWARTDDSDHFCAMLDICASTGVPEELTRLLRDVPDDGCAECCAVSTVWSAFAAASDTWPGGEAALAARAKACDAYAALKAAREACTRLRAAGGRSPPESFASFSDLLQAETHVWQLLKRAREIAADAAATALLAEEEAVAAAAATKAQRKQEAKARRAAAAQAAAALAAAAAEQAAAEAAAASAARSEAARAAAQAAAAADAAAHAARRDAAAVAAAAEQQRQQRARQPAPPMPPLQPSPLAAPPAEEARASDALLAELFPWMRMHDDPSPHVPQPALPAAAGAAGGIDDDDDGDDGCCAICMDAPRTAALVPCGHALLCDACAAKVLATAAPLCPVCRVAVTAARAAA